MHSRYWRSSEPLPAGPLRIGPTMSVTLADGGRLLVSSKVAATGAEAPAPTETAHVAELRVSAACRPLRGAALRATISALGSPSLQKLSLLGSAIDHQLLEQASEALGRNQGVSSIVVGMLSVGTRLDSSHLALFLRSSLPTAFPAELRAQMCRLGPACAIVLATRAQVFQSLVLPACGLGPREVGVILEAHMPNLKILQLDRNREALTCARTCETLGARMTDACLRKLFIRDTGISQASLASMATSIIDHGGTLSTLHELRIGENDLSAIEAQRGLGTIVRLCPDLQCLECSRCQLSGIGIVAIAAAVRCRAATLERLILARNPLTDASVAALRAIILVNAGPSGALRDLDLFGCLFGVRGAAALTVAALRAPRLNLLNVAGDVDVWASGGMTRATSGGVAMSTAGTCREALPSPDQPAAWEALVAASRSHESCLLPWLCGQSWTSRLARPAAGAVAELAGSAAASAAAAGPSVDYRVPSRQSALRPLTRRRLVGVCVDPLKAAAPACCKLSMARLAASVSRDRTLRARRRSLLVDAFLGETARLPGVVVRAITDFAWGGGKILDNLDALEVLW